MPGGVRIRYAARAAGGGGAFAVPEEGERRAAESGGDGDRGCYGGCLAASTGSPARRPDGLLREAARLYLAGLPERGEREE